MKILLVSKEANGGDLGLRLELEGHKVKFHIHNDEGMKNLDGLIEKEKNWRGGVSWADFVILDDTGLDDVAEFVLKANKPCFGSARKRSLFLGKEIKPHEFASTLEKERKFSQHLLQALGVGERVESLEFSDLGKAIQHLKSHKVPHVIKPEVFGSGSEKTYVGEKEDGSDAIGWLETLPNRPGAGKIKKIEIEERIMGVEVACSTWFNGKDFIGLPNINFEHKKLATGDLGFNTGEMGTVMFYEHGPCKFFKDTVEKMGQILRNVDYRGQLDINCIVNKDGLFPLEFTPRLGYPALYIEDELQDSDWGEMLFAIASGKPCKPKVGKDIAIGALLVGEGYPFWDEGHKRMDGMPISGISQNTIKNVHFYDVMFKDRWLCAGCLPLVATEKGKTVEEARKNLYEIVIPQFHFPGMYYRTDIGAKVDSQLKDLSKWGWRFSHA